VAEWTEPGRDAQTRVWRSDGSPAGTFPLLGWLSAWQSGTGGLTPVGDQGYFRAWSQTSGVEPWRTDGSVAGTRLRLDLNPGPASSFLNNLTNLNGTLVFQAVTPATGVALWTSDGTAAGTALLLDPVPGPYSGRGIANLTSLNGVLYFNCWSEATGREL